MEKNLIFGKSRIIGKIQTIEKSKPRWSKPQKKLELRKRFEYRDTLERTIRRHLRTPDSSNEELSQRDRRHLRTPDTGDEMPNQIDQRPSILDSSTKRKHTDSSEYLYKAIIISSQKFTESTFSSEHSNTPDGCIGDL